MSQSARRWIWYQQKGFLNLNIQLLPRGHKEQSRGLGWPAQWVEPLFIHPIDILPLTERPIDVKGTSHPSLEPTTNEKSRLAEEKENKESNKQRDFSSTPSIHPTMNNGEAKLPRRSKGSLQHFSCHGTKASHALHWRGDAQHKMTSGLPSPLAMIR
jgi:hypothetical protein